ncbi:MAG: hypothetical protein ACPGVU_20275, partial [Limisphaerales bacterium]
YLPPYDKGRLGNPYPQRHEPYVQIETRTNRLRLLTVFCVTGPGETSATWSDGTIETPEGRISVEVTETELAVKRANATGVLRLPLN